jgi:hypothetical protein
LYSNLNALAEYDKYGERSTKSELPLWKSYLSELAHYFRTTPPPEWEGMTPSRIPKCRNFFYKKFANLAIQLVNKQLHFETSLILSRLIRILETSISRRQLSDSPNPIPAFLSLISQNPVHINAHGYDLISFLQTTDLSTFSSIRSIYFDRDFIKVWDDGIVELIWGIRYDQYDKNGIFGLMIRLVTSRLLCLEEIAIWAPNDDWEEEQR